MNGIYFRKEFLGYNAFAIYNLPTTKPLCLVTLSGPYQIMAYKISTAVVVGRAFLNERTDNDSGN